MKKTLSIFLCLIIVVSLFGCNNTSAEVESNTPTEEILNNISNVTEKSSGVIYDTVPPPKSISLDSPKDELSQMREILYCADKELLEKALSSWGCYTTEELLTFLDVVDSISYIDALDGDITWISYQKYVDHGILYITTTAENGDWVRLTYMIGLENPSYWVYEKVKQETSNVISNSVRSEDSRVSLHSEVRKKHPVYPGQYVEWVGFVDGIGVEILYYASNISGINSNSLLASLTISSLTQTNPVAPELMEQISEGMTYKEVKEIIGALQKDISSENIVFEYYLSDGRTAQIEFQKLNETDDLNDYTVMSITIE